MGTEELPVSSEVFETIVRRGTGGVGSRGGGGLASRDNFSFLFLFIYIGLRQKCLENPGQALGLRRESREIWDKH